VTSPRTFDRASGRPLPVGQERGFAGIELLRSAGLRPTDMRIELDREEDGRWLTEIPELPGVMAYGQTRDEALARVKGA
jgi:hypothetical protein